MTRGPAPQPTAIRERRGNPGHRKVNRQEPKPVAGIPKPPDRLSERAKRHWWEIAHELHSLGVLTTLDRDALALLCEDYAEIVELTEFLKKKGRTYESKTRLGAVMVRQRPEVRLLNEARKRYRGLLEQFGMTPSSRTRVAVQDRHQDAADPFAVGGDGVGKQANPEDAFLYGKFTVVAGGG